jgi:hypothetical protein
MARCMVRLLLVAILAAFISCKHKKISLADNEPVEVSDFIEFFQTIKLPCQFSDTSLDKHKADSLGIGFKTFTQFVPDSILSRNFGKMSHPKLYPAGKVGDKKSETYLFVKAIGTYRKVLYVICFDKSQKFSAAKPLIILDGESRGNWLATIDSKYTITLLRQRKMDGQVFYRKEAYVYNDAGVFTLILTESNEEKPKPVSVYNPIDTLAHKHKFSGDYAQDHRNFVSVRDAKDPARMLFFVHFEKDQGTCNGELKGEAKFVSASSARFKSNRDPCAIEFSFVGNEVRMKELEACGSHRDIKCFFEGTFVKRKEPKQKPAKKKAR